MTTYVLLGHGGFDPEYDRYPKEILVPQDTTVKFWSEAGEALVLPAEGDNSDYSQVAPAFNQLKEAQPSQGPTKTTYNYALYPEDHQAEVDGAKRADWNGATLVHVTSGKVFLCQDTEGKCPTPDLLNSTDEAVITNPDRWMHHCDGILGTYGGNGNEINWVACTSFEVQTPQLPSEITGDHEGPGMWEPDNDALQAATQRNQSNVKATKDGETVQVIAGGVMVLVGDGHDNHAIGYVRGQDDLEEGVLEVTKASIFAKGKGTLEVRGITNKANQDLIKEELEDFSKKDVVFS